MGEQEQQPEALAEGLLVPSQGDDYVKPEASA